MAEPSIRGCIHSVFRKNLPAAFRRTPSQETAEETLRFLSPVVSWVVETVMELVLNRTNVSLVKTICNYSAHFFSKSA